MAVTSYAMMASLNSSEEFRRLAEDGLLPRHVLAQGQQQDDFFVFVAWRVQIGA